MSEWATGSLKACIFIDGIDEFDGDHAKLAAFLMELSSPSIRMVLSSRPILACEEVFADCQNLKLQDLNLPDIKRYVHDKLATQEQMKELVAGQPSEASQLFQEIISKASGVFLWVVLVVTSLLNGLRNFDNISDLRRRLEELPPDLHALYVHMFARMEPWYRRQASQLFQLVACAGRVQPIQPLNVFLLSYADEEEDDNMALNAPVCRISDAKLDKRVRRMDKRLRSRCCGLLEIHQKRPMIDSEVQYLHRSVREFLATDGIWDRLLEFTASSDFWPGKRLMQASLVMLKKSPISPFPRLKRVYEFVSYALETEVSTKRPQAAVLDEMDRVLSSTRPMYIKHWSSAIPAKQPSGESFFAFTVRYGLTLYVQEALRRNESLISNSSRPILFHALHPELDEISTMPLTLRFNLIDTLLKHGARVDAIHQGVSAWQFLLDTFMHCGAASTAPIGQILKLFIYNGADPLQKVKVPLDSGSGQYLQDQTAIDIVHTKCKGQDGRLTDLGLELSQMLMDRSQSSAAPHCLPSAITSDLGTMESRPSRWAPPEIVIHRGNVSLTLPPE
ncbi:hypothetical protein LTR28_011487, partial [Elasticomyces elasticus]